MQKNYKFVTFYLRCDSYRTLLSYNFIFLEIESGTENLNLAFTKAEIETNSVHNTPNYPQTVFASHPRHFPNSTFTV